MKVNQFLVAACVAAAYVFGANRLQATELTFGGTFGTIDPAYGDRVTSTSMGGYTYAVAGEGFTPNVTVEYDPLGGYPSVWPSGYGDLAGPTLYEFDQSTKLQVKFTADPGLRVRLHRWDLATFSQFQHPNGESINGITVYNAVGTPIFSQSNLLIPSVGRRRFENFASPLADTTLTLEIDARNVTTGFGNEDIGLDNIVFSQVPEPTSAAILFVAATMLGVGRSRRRLKRDQLPNLFA